MIASATIVNVDTENFGEVEVEVCITALISGHRYVRIGKSNDLGAVLARALKQWEKRRRAILQIINEDALR